MTWSEAEEAFRASFAGYEPRLPQRNLAQQIENALGAAQPILAEAPTGTGKSFAAMVPAIDHARATRRPVCAATGTKNLQDQYIKDMETLKDVYLPDLKYVVLKGRSNYICQAKVADLRKGEEPFHMDLDMIMEAAQQEGVNGDIERLGFAVPAREVAQLTISTDECPGRTSCPFGEICFAERQKAKAETADVVIANHALVAIDSVLKAQNIPMLPDFAGLVVDEAHEFEQSVSNALSVEITERGLTDLANRVVEFTGDRAALGRANVTAANLFNKLRKIVEVARQDDEYGRADIEVAITPALLVTLQDELLSVLRMLDYFQAKLATAEAHTDEQVLKRKRLRKRVEKMIEKGRNIVMAEFGDMVRWIEVKAKTRRDASSYERLALKQAPLDVAPFLAQHVWANQPCTALVSATLSIGGDFSYLAARLGMNEVEYRSFSCPSPFDYPNQAVNYLARSIPEPTGRTTNEHRAAVNANITELVRAADGRALLLFTSHKGLKTAYEALKPVIASMGHTVLRQGDAPSRQLAQEFLADEHSVLFATKTFFTGVDIRGDSLRLLVIDKLPFPVPNVLFEAQCQAINDKAGNKWASFTARQVPEMTITLTQAIGRLIRSTSDRGLVAVLDPRLFTKGYGKGVRAAIETTFPSPVVTELADAVAYLESLEVIVDEDTPDDLAGGRWGEV